MSAAETITTTPDALKEIVEGALATQREEFDKDMAKALEALELGKTKRTPVQTGDDDTRADVVDEKLEAMRAAAAPAMQVISRGMTEGWERKAAFHYKTSNKIPEASRALRNAEDDWHMKEWILGRMLNGDPARAMRAAEFLYRKYARVGVAGNLQTVDAGFGLELVPEPLADLVYIQKQLVQVMAPMATNFTHAAGNLKVPKELVTKLAQATKVAETTDSDHGGGTTTPAVVLTDVQFGRLLLLTKKGAARILVNDELMEQAAFDVITLLTGQAGRALGRLSDDQIVVDGDGTGNNHTDSLTTNTDIDATTVGTTFTETKVVEMWGIPIAGHRANGIWVTDIAGLRVLNKLTDTSGKVIFTPNDPALSVLVGQGQGVAGIGTMLNRPVFEVNNAGGLLFFGDPEAIAVLGDGKGIRSKAEAIPGQDTSIFSWTEQQDSRLLEGTAWARTSVAISP